MARRTKAEIALEKEINDACQLACNGRQIDIMKLHLLTKAGQEAAKNGQNIYEAVLNVAKKLNNLPEVD